MQDNNRQSPPSQAEQLQQQNPNPDRLNISDEKQRTTGREANQDPQQMPVGNEQNNQDTQGTIAGVGE